LSNFYNKYKEEYLNIVQPQQDQSSSEPRSIDLPFIGETVCKNKKAKYFFIFQGTLQKPDRLSVTVLSCLWGINSSEIDLFQTFWLSTYHYIVRLFDLNSQIAKQSYVVDAKRTKNRLSVPICFLCLHSCIQNGENNYRSLLEALKNQDINYAYLQLDFLNTKNPSFHYKDTTIEFLKNAINTQTTKKMQLILNTFEADSSISDTTELSSRNIKDSLNLAKDNNMIALHKDDINMALADSIVLAYKAFASQKYNSVKIVMEKEGEELEKANNKVKPLFVGMFSKIENSNAAYALTGVRSKITESYIISSDGTYRFRHNEINHTPKLYTNETDESKGTWKCFIRDTSIILICNGKRSYATDILQGNYGNMNFDNRKDNSDWEECADTTTFTLDNLKEEYKKSR